MRRPGASCGGGIELARQRPAKIDGCSRQNSAYRPGRTLKFVEAKMSPSIKNPRCLFDSGDFCLQLMKTILQIRMRTQFDF